MLSRLNQLHMPDPPYKLRALVTQWGSLAVALVLGAALVGTAMLNYRDALAASRGANLGQGMQILRQLRMQWDVSGDVLREALPRMVQPDGATYVGVWEAGKIGRASCRERV